MRIHLKQTVGIGSRSYRTKQKSLFSEYLFSTKRYLAYASHALYFWVKNFVDPEPRFKFKCEGHRRIIWKIQSIFSLPLVQSCSKSSTGCLWSMNDDLKSNVKVISDHTLFCLEHIHSSLLSPMWLIRNLNRPFLFNGLMSLSTKSMWTSQQIFL